MKAMQLVKQARHGSVSARHMSSKASSSSSSSASSVSFPPLTPLSLANYPATRITTLNNGVRVATETRKGPVGGASVGVWVGGGARYEPVSGLSNLISRLNVSGSTTKRSGAAVAAAVDAAGAELTSSVCREQSSLIYRGNKATDALPVLAEQLLQQKLDATELSQWKETMIRELEVEHDNNEQLEDVLTERLHETAFRNTRLARPVKGTINDVNSITAQTIKEFQASTYTGRRVVIAGAGDVSHDDLVAQAKQLFGSLPAAAAQESVTEPGHFTGSDILVRDDSISTARLAVSWQTGPINDADHYALKVIGALLGSFTGTSASSAHSPLWLPRTVAGENSEQRQMAHSYRPFLTSYSDVGLFGLRGVCDPTNLYEMSWAFMKATIDLVFDVDEDCLATAKTNLKAQLLQRIDSSHSSTEDIGRSVLAIGRRIHPAEVVARIDAVDAKAVKDAARRFFYDRDVAVAAVGFIHEVPDYNWFRSRTYRLRY